MAKKSALWADFFVLAIENLYQYNINVFL